MEYLGKGRVITDKLCWIEQGDIVYVHEYEEGEERDSLENADYRIFDDSYSFDVYEDEIELIR